MIVNVYLVLKPLYQEKYKFSESVLSDLPEINHYRYSERDKVIHPDEAKPNSTYKS